MLLNGPKAVLLPLFLLFFDVQRALLFPALSETEKQRQKH